MELFNDNFLMGWLISKDRDDNSEAIKTGLTASQFPANNPMGVLLLKNHVDTIIDLEQQVESLKNEGVKISDLTKQVAELTTERDKLIQQVSDLTSQLEECRLKFAEVKKLVNSYGNKFKITIDEADNVKLDKAKDLLKSTIGINKPNVTKA